MAINTRYGRKFSCVLHHGECNSLKTEQVIEAPSAADAAKEFMYQHFPDGTLYTPGRVEGRTSIHSFGVNVSGQRLWVYEEIA